MTLLSFKYCLSHLLLVTLLLLTCRQTAAFPSFLPTKTRLLYKSATGLHSTEKPIGDEDGSIKKINDSVSIEYCTGCRWMLRSAWMAQELLTTFQNELDSVTLIPSRPPNPGGVFLVTYNQNQIVWDRKVDGGFPESKQLKQKIRDLIAPEQFLGHSDTSNRQQQQETGVEEKDEQTQAATTPVIVEKCEDCPNDPPPPSVEDASGGTMSSTSPYDCHPSPNVQISYCTGCRWLLRAAWMAQELLTTFDTELNSITLCPSRPPTAPGGTFTIQLDYDGKDVVLWDRKALGRFPEMKEIKQKIRDEIAPEHDLGHSDKKEDSKKDPSASEEAVDQFEYMSDDEAEDMRNFFGVM